MQPDQRDLCGDTVIDRLHRRIDPGQRSSSPPAKEAKSNARLGQHGALSGFLLYSKINCALAQFGQDQVTAPPAQPQLPALAPQNLVITITSGTIALKLTCPTSPGEGTIVRASARSA